MAEPILDRVVKLVQESRQDPMVTAPNALAIIREAGIDLPKTRWHSWIRTGKIKTKKVLGTRWVPLSEVERIIKKMLEGESDE